MDMWVTGLLCALIAFLLFAAFKWGDKDAKEEARRLHQLREELPHADEARAREIRRILGKAKRTKIEIERERKIWGDPSDLS